MLGILSDRRMGLLVHILDLKVYQEGQLNRNTLYPVEIMFINLTRCAQRQVHSKRLKTFTMCFKRGFGFNLTVINATARHERGTRGAGTVGP